LLLVVPSMMTLVGLLLSGLAAMNGTSSIGVGSAPPTSYSVSASWPASWLRESSHC
jgi:hypothetical protein